MATPICTNRKMNKVEILGQINLALKSFSEIEESPEIPYQPKLSLSRIYSILEIDSPTVCFLRDLNYTEFLKRDEWIIQPEAESPDAASLEQLILYLTSPDAPNLTFQRQMLCSLVSFTEPKILLAALFTRFFPESYYSSTLSSVIHSIQLRVIRIICAWIKLTPYQFSPSMLCALEQFLAMIQSSNKMKAQANVLERHMSDFRQRNKRSVLKGPKGVPPEPILQNTHPSEWTLLNIDPVELARQVTLYHAELWYTISPMELLTNVSNTSGRLSNEMVIQFDKFARFVSFTVISGPDPHQRGRIYKRWIDVAGAFRTYNNFNGCFAIMVGLNHASVTRMKETIKCAMRTNRQRKTMLEELNNICTINNDFSQYREVIKTALEPCIPFIGCFQKDLVYIQESYPDRINGLINFKKCQKCCELLDFVARKQNETYPFMVIHDIQMLIRNMEEPPGTIELMKLSIFTEKRKVG